MNQTQIRQLRTLRYPEIPNGISNMKKLLKDMTITLGKKFSSNDIPLLAEINREVKDGLMLKIKYDCETELLFGGDLALLIIDKEIHVDLYNFIRALSNTPMINDIRIEMEQLVDYIIQELVIYERRQRKRKV